MTRFSFRTLVAIAGLSAILVTSSVASRGPQGPGGPGPEGFDIGRLVDRASERLELTPTQEDDIRTVLESRRAGARADLERLREAHDDLRRAVQALDADESSIRASAAKVASVQSDLAVARAQTLRDVRDVLDDDQVAELQEVLDASPERGKGPSGHARRGHRARR